MCLLFLCTLSAAAQDVIIKKDGNTIVCRVVELTKTEVTYKRWTDLQGSNYVMNLKDVSAIHYENGEKKTFDSTTEQGNNSNEQATINKEPQYIDDGALLAMVEKADKVEKTKKPKKKVDVNTKITRLKKAGWTCGIILVSAGVIQIGTSFSEDADLTPATGVLLSAGGAIITVSCLAKANNLKKQTMNRVTSTPVWENKFQLKNTTLSTQICTIQDSYQKAPTLGFGISYQF